MDFIKLSRKLIDWEWYADINTCRLFVHMLLKANWKDGNFRGLIIPRGSFVSSIGKLAEETDLTEREIRTAICHLKSTGEVTSKSTNRFTVFTVVNYCLYQTSDKQGDIQAPSKRQANDKLTTTIEEYKEYKNNNIPPISPAVHFDEFWDTYPKKGNRSLTEKAYVDVLLSNVPEEDVLAAVRNYAEAVRIQDTQERYIKNPERFLTDNTFLDYLPGNYKKPSAAKTTGAKQNQFNQFSQREYDFTELEQKLLSK